jgi:membrane-associated phospholipid phosphatase
MAAVTAGTLICSLVSITGLRLGFPLADPLLHSADRLVGLNTSRAVIFASSEPLLSKCLHLIYDHSDTLCLITALWALIWGERARYWIITITAVIAAQLTGIISIFFPAEGAILHLGLDVLQGQGLPFGAGSYSASEFRAFYWGSDLRVSRDDLAGIVVFPSFHTVMALIILQGFFETRFRWPALILCVLAIISTVPMGGHYVVDILGGAIVWAASYLLSVRVCEGWQTVPLSPGDLGAVLRRAVTKCEFRLRRDAGSLD